MGSTFVAAGAESSRARQTYRAQTTDGRGMREVPIRVH
jgi:hypothetical protein